MKVEEVALERLHEHPANPRQGDTGAIVESIKAHGWFGALVVNRDGTVLCGNHRLKAARELGMAKVPVFRVDVNDETALRILLADNRTSDLASWDDGALAGLLVDLQQQTERGMTGLGWDTVDLDALIAEVARGNGTGLVDPGPGELPETPDVLTKPGDLWVLGEHRLLCGDAAKARDYAKLLDGGSPDLLLTDPPYGVAIGDKNAMLNAHGRGNPHEGPLENDTGIAEVEVLWRAAFPAMRDAMACGCPFYVFGPQGGDLGLLLLLLLLRESDIPARHILIWVKDRPTFSLGRLDYEYAHEPICYGWKAGAAHPWYGDGQHSSVIHEPRPSESKLHPTMKPLPLIERLIRNSTLAGAVVLDPFGGSGTTLIAAEAVHRRARLIEIDPGYCDVIVNRWQDYTGKKAELA